MARSGLGGVTAGRAFVVIEALDKTQRTLRAVETRFFRMGARIQQAGATMLMRGIQAAAPAAISMKIFSDFDDAMRRVQARSQGTASEMKEVREQAKLLGRTSAFTARQVANLQAILAQRGFNRREIMDMTPSVMTLARAAGSGNREADILTSADLVAGTLKAFQMDANMTSTVIDKMTAAVNNSNFKLDDLQNSMSLAGAVAHQFNLSLDKTLAILGSMRQINLDPSIVGTGLRNLFIKGASKDNVEKFNRMLTNLGGSAVQFRDDMNNLREPQDILFDFMESASKMGTADRTDILKEVFGLRAFVPALALAQGRGEYEKLLKGIQTSGGLGGQTSTTMDEGIGGSFRFLVSATEGISEALGRALAPATQTVNEGITEVQNSITEWIDKNQELTTSLYLAVAATIALGSALIAIGTGIKLIGLIFSPAWLVGFAGLAAAFYAIGDTAIQVVQDITQALRQGNFEGAWALMLKGAEVTWVRFMDKVLFAWNNKFSYMKLGILRFYRTFWSNNPFFSGATKTLIHSRFTKEINKTLLDLVDAREGTASPELRKAKREYNELKDRLEFESKLPGAPFPQNNPNNALDLPSKGRYSSGTSQAAGNLTPSLIEGLQRGSVRAAEAFYKNQQKEAKTMGEQLNEANNHLGSIDRKFSNPVVVGAV